jgi:uncharacterized protein
MKISLGQTLAISSIVCFAILVSTAAQAQGRASFNCNTAQRPDEVLICQSDELSALDRELSSTYFRLRNSLSGEARDQLANSQAGWLRQ